MMTSAEIRQSFLDFFKSKQHTIVPSSSLLPDSPNLLFTNAGMNQFVPIFLGQSKPQWSPPRVADTQKCIRAGGKHNDLEDVGLDTYHHTFFEMFGNWSFGDYFKREAIDWAWELLTQRWHFPKERLYATYFGGDDKIPADAEARDLWLRYLPDNQIVPGNRKDNFWMMGDTGPCGPCSEIHVDLTPAGSGGAKLVNAGSPQCIEIWNLVFIQFNSNPDGSLSALPAKHVDTGMGFERVCGIIQCTDGFKDFTRTISNYESDVFTPIFGELEKLSGKKYTSTLPQDSNTPSLQHSIDVAFRVIADHIRCLSFAIADGIAPSNEGRGYVLRRILRRAVRYARTIDLDLTPSFLSKLSEVVIKEYAATFPELKGARARIRSLLDAEETSFKKTVARGIVVFNERARLIQIFNSEMGKSPMSALQAQFPADAAFELYDTYGFPLDLTELMARERGLTVDVDGFEKLMEEQRLRAREDYQKKKSSISVIEGSEEVESSTKFIGYEHLEAEAEIQAITPDDVPSQFGFILSQTPFYAEGGGQVADTGVLLAHGEGNKELSRMNVSNTQRLSDVFIHTAKLVSGHAPELGDNVVVKVDAARRGNIQRHHTVTHLFHWALHEVVSRDARQRGSLVAPDHLRFDFNHPEKLSSQQIADIEKLVNERIEEDVRVWTFPMKYTDVKGNPKIMQFFGDKYGDEVRVVQIGGQDKQLDGFSIELCGGTHTKTTGDIGLFKIAKESAIAAGIRRVEAVCGQFAQEFIEKQRGQEQVEVEKAKAREQEKEFAKQRQAEMQSQAPAIAEQLLVKMQGKLLVENLGDASTEMLRAVMDVLKPKLTSGVVVLGGGADGKVSLICYVTPDLVKQGKNAGKIVGELAKICGGGGGGKPDLAQAGGKQPEKLAEALAAAPRIIGA